MMLASQPRWQSLPAAWLATSSLTLHEAWRQYRHQRPLIVWPLERAARLAFDFVAHHLRCWHSDLYAHAHGAQVRSLGLCCSPPVLLVPPALLVLVAEV